MYNRQIIDVRAKNVRRLQHKTIDFLQNIGMKWLQSFWGPEVANFGPLDGLSVQTYFNYVKFYLNLFSRFRLADLFPKISCYKPLCSGTFSILMTKILNASVSLSQQIPPLLTVQTLLKLFETADVNQDLLKQIGYRL